VASILSLHSRRCADQAAKRVLEENVNRVLSIAAIHDILTQNEGSLPDVDSCALLEQLRKNLQSLVPEGIRIQVQAAEPGVMLPADVASAVALVVNELVTNALKHAFPDRDSGRVCISFRPGALFHTVTVSDDGVGFDPEHIGGRGSLGLRIVEATVRDRLHSQLNIHSDQEGTRISFDLKTE